jgi:hypothetical protein
MRVIGLYCILGLAVALGSGCAGDKPEKWAKKESAAPRRAVKDGKAGDASISKDGSPKSRELAEAETMVAGAPSEPVGPRTGKRSRKEEPQAGLLTAGSFDDNLNPALFRSFVERMRQNPAVRDLPSRFLGQRLIVSVRDRDGAPVGNARVQLVTPNARTAVELVTRTDGQAVFLASWDRWAADASLTVTVQPPDGSRPVRQAVPSGSSRWEITLSDTQAAPPRNLDLAIVLDTTGSMGDELKFLQTEIKSIAGAIARKFPEIRQHYALILYRDQGDEYVTRRFDFTPSLEEFRNHLAAQNAAGGGDYPEAMHAGLEEAVKLQWRDHDTARVLFLIADAPPHAQFMHRTLAAADQLRKKGVAIYPVACSGYDDAAEFVMRSCSLLTGSQFLFLTDDSGVGNAHAEPHIPFYRVQRLEQLMIRMIASELAGKHLEPQPGEVLRTVGKPIN